MTHTIAVAGKGGVGKTTTCGMMIEYLCKKGDGPILVVDADANSNLNEVLGVEVEATLGDIREEIARAEMAKDNPIPLGMSKADYAEMKFESALIEEDDELTEGTAEIQLSDTVEDYSNKIYLEKFFVRTESDGRSYVMKQDENGLLAKQYVETGRTIYGYAIEVVKGVTMQDKLAFPYGNNVVEGAKTKEVDQLDYS